MGGLVNAAGLAAATPTLDGHAPLHYSVSTIQNSLMAPCLPASISSPCTNRLVVVKNSSGIATTQKPPLLLSSFVSRSFGTNFFGDGASLVSTMPLSSSGRGAMGASMNIFERVVRIVKSYANALISAAEDPEKILEQTVIEMNEDLVKMRQASAQVLASQKQLENKYITAQKNADEWYARARLALQKGEEDLAREALKRRKDYEDNAKALKAQLDQQRTVVDKLISSTRLLESKIQEAKSKKDTLKARAQSAKTASKVNEMLGTVNTSSALSAFERMEEKVTALEAEADALNQLNTDDLAGKFALLEGDAVDDDLAALKQEMLGSSKRPSELPAGRPAASSGPYPYKDIEIEKELSDLRRKVNDL
ncbi:hypothetical protein KP509_25G000800 [Ceratopteris richardii]|uniref:Uncharacterized protein n=1 Tax=Ceratopteris richardii TaxID=49495 RepID=A0A8T2RMC1_CERRI|nr:hypothetical protein KP509_25G000800 [Ceratopteris richardii]